MPTQAFSLQTGFLYIPTIRTGSGTANGEKAADLPDRNSTRLQAWIRWREKKYGPRKHRVPGTAGLMATAGNAVFEGMGDGTFNAFDARTGRKLWTFDVHFGMAGAPISYEVDGKQYVSIVAGWGGGGGGRRRRELREIWLAVWLSGAPAARPFVLDGKTPPVAAGAAGLRGAGRRSAVRDRSKAGEGGQCRRVP